MNTQTVSTNRANLNERAEPSNLPGTRFDERLLLGRLRRKLLSRASGSVLDIACGAGVNFEHFPEHCQITAIDTSIDAVSAANRNALAMSRDIAVRTMDAHRMDFPDASFDTVVSSLSLCSYTDPIVALREMSRVCAPGGTILLLEHGRSSFGLWAKWQDYKEKRRGPHTGCHGNREPLELVKQAGLYPSHARRAFLGVMHLIGAHPSTSHAGG